MYEYVWMSAGLRNSVSGESGGRERVRMLGIGRTVDIVFAAPLSGRTARRRRLLASSKVSPCISSPFWRFARSDQVWCSTAASSASFIVISSSLPALRMGRMIS